MRGFYFDKIVGSFFDLNWVKVVGGLCEYCKIVGDIIDFGLLWF